MKITFSMVKTPLIIESKIVLHFALFSIHFVSLSQLLSLKFGSLSLTLSSAETETAETAATPSSSTSTGGAVPTKVVQIVDILAPLAIALMAA